MRRRQTAISIPESAMNPLFPPDAVQLELSNLKVHFRPLGRKRSSPDDFELEVSQFTAQGGTMIGLAGRSGEGKSTLLHILGTLLRPPRTENAAFRAIYHYPGAPASGFCYSTSCPERDAERVRNGAFGFIFQHHFNLPCMAAEANVALPYRLRPGFQRRRASARCQSLLRELRLEEQHWSKFPAELSGGMNQRLAICRALVHEPPFLFADEPTASLDAGLKTKVLGWLRSHADRGACVIVVSHEIGDLARYCDRILVVANGRLCFPFARDDSEGSRELRALPALPPTDSNRPRYRDDGDVDTVLRTLTPLIWPPGSAQPAAVPEERVRAAGGAPSEPELRMPIASLGRLGMRGGLWGFAFREVWGRRHRGLHLMTAFLVLLGTAIFVYLTDLGEGTIAFLKARDLIAPDEFINRINIDAASGKGGFTPEQVQFLSEIKGLKAPPTLSQAGEGIRFLPRGRTEKDDAVRVEIASVPVGDDTLAAIPLTQRDSARQGVCYLVGGPFTSADADRAGLIVSRRFLRTRYWRIEDEDTPNPAVADPAEGPPSFLEVCLAGGGRWDPPGYNGRVRLPIRGVFEYPVPVIEALASGKEEYLPLVYLNFRKVF